MYKFIDDNGAPLVKHIEFFQKAMASVEGKEPFRKMFFGGGIRGGKSYLCLFILICLARRYPGSRSHIIRESLPTLKSTIAKSLDKLIEGTGCQKYSPPGVLQYRFDNGSTIELLPESFNTDKDLNRFKGFETNFILLEQIEELQFLTYQKCIERSGTWLLPHGEQPNPLILSTMNPTSVKWVRDLVLHPYEEKRVPEDTFIQMVTAADNPFIPTSLHENWSSMEPEQYKQFVEGNWYTDTIKNAFFYNFDERIHVKQAPLNGTNLVLSFDFNVNPMTCLIADVGPSHVHVLKEIRQENSSIAEIVRELAPLVRGRAFRITGDSTGTNRDARTASNSYSLIMSNFKSLGIQVNPNALYVPKVNLSHVISRQICASAFHNLNIIIDPSCEYLIQDFKLVTTNEKGSIDKKNLKLTHLSDCFRYIIQTFFYSTLLKTPTV